LATQIAAFAAALRTKGETVDELIGFVTAMRDYAMAITVPDDCIDTCGTGGDGSGTINVSTLAGIVAAGAGARVCKHGGRASSSQPGTGSADVLEALGVAIDLGPDGVRRCVQEAGIGFCLAVRYHPAMRFAAPVRRELGVPTVFNVLGPLVNPAQVRRQVVGVGRAGLADKMAAVLSATGTIRAMIVRGDDGLDELSTVTTSTVIQLERHDDGSLESRVEVIDPSLLGLAPATLDELRGGDATKNAELARQVLGGEHGARRDLVVLNGAAALVVAGRAGSLSEGIEQAVTSIDSGAAARSLDRLIAVSQECASDEARHGSGEAR